MKRAIRYDDGPIADRRPVALMNRYGLRGTFHLDSGRLGTKGYVNREEMERPFPT